MNESPEPRAQVYEVTSVLTAAPGVSIEEALAAARLQGYQALHVDRTTNTATILWFKKA